MDSELPRISEHADPADKLRYYRESKGMSQQQLGEIFGKSSWYINNFEKRFNAIYYEDAVRFAEILDIEPEELLDEYTRFCKPGYGKRICSIRDAYELSQVKFAELVGTSRSTVSIWEAEINNHHPNQEKYERLKELAEQKGIDINDT